MTGQPECRHTDQLLLSCCHTGCDGKKCGLTCDDGRCDGIGGKAVCRHNTLDCPCLRAESRSVGNAVTTRAAGERAWREISSSEDGVTVRLPVEAPALTSRAARALLAILVELTDVPVLDRPGEGTRDDR